MMIPVKKSLLLFICVLPLLVGCVLISTEPTPLPWIPTVTPEPTTVTPTAEVPAFNPPSPQVSPTSVPVKTATPVPAPTSTPTPQLSPTPTPTPISQVITIIKPTQNAIVDNPVEISGQVAIMPFEGTLVVRIYDAQDQLLAETPIIAQGNLGEPGNFEATIAYGGSPGTGRLEIYDFSPKDGSVIASAVVDITLGGFTGGGYIERPQPQSSVTLPLQVLARTGIPGQQVNVALSWVDGTKITQPLTVLQGVDGRGFIMTTLDLDSATAYPHTQQALLEIRDAQGITLSQQQVTVMGPNDANAMVTNVYWIVNENVQAQSILIPRTLGIGRASLEALLWGPAPNSPAGYISAIPSPEEILNYAGRTAAWGERIQLNSLAIIDGVAHADFSIEMTAHPGGALRVTLIRQQIEQTLLQFSTVNSVSITIDGRDGVLEP